MPIPFLSFSSFKINSTYSFIGKLLKRKKGRNNLIFFWIISLKSVYWSHHIICICTQLFLFKSLYTSGLNSAVFLHAHRASRVSEFASPIYDLIKSEWYWDGTCKGYPFSGHYRRFQFNTFKCLKSLNSTYLQCKVLICDCSNH